MKHKQTNIREIRNMINLSAVRPKLGFEGPVRWFEGGSPDAFDGVGKAMNYDSARKNPFIGQTFAAQVARLNRDISKLNHQIDPDGRGLQFEVDVYSRHDSSNGDYLYNDRAEIKLVDRFGMPKIERRAKRSYLVLMGQSWLLQPRWLGENSNRAFLNKIRKNVQLICNEMGLIR